MGHESEQKVAIIIPARNEATRIGDVIQAVLGSRYASEVIVVDDGSTDDTSSVASEYPNVHVITLPENLGKAGAMDAGVKATDAKILAFVDADLGGLRGEHIDRFIRPVVRGESDMCLGIFKGGKVFSDAAQRVSPYLSGQRALKRELFEAVPYTEDLGMGIEFALNWTAKKRKARVTRVILRGVYNCHKEKKEGAFKGVAARFKMWGEIGQAAVRMGNKPRRKPWTKGRWKKPRKKR